MTDVGYRWICSQCGVHGEETTCQARDVAVAEHRKAHYGHLVRSDARPWLRMEMPLPPAPLSPNAENQKRGRFSEYTLAREQYRTDCYLVAVDARNRERWTAPQRASIFLQFCLKRGAPGFYRPGDWDNAVASIKAMQDALVRAEVIIDDDWKHLSCGGVTHTYESGPGVVVEVTAL